MQPPPCALREAISNHKLRLVIHCQAAYIGALHSNVHLFQIAACLRRRAPFLMFWGASAHSETHSVSSCPFQARSFCGPNVVL